MIVGAQTPFLRARFELRRTSEAYSHSSTICLRQVSTNLGALWTIERGLALIVLTLSTTKPDWPLRHHHDVKKITFRPDWIKHTIQGPPGSKSDGVDRSTASSTPYRLIGQGIEDNRHAYSMSFFDLQEYLKLSCKTDGSFEPSSNSSKRHFRRQRRR